MQQPRLHQRGEHGHVAARLRLAVVERAHAVPHLEPDVPEEREEPADRLVRVVLGGAVEQHEQVDVRLRMQLAAPVAAYRDEIGRVGQPLAVVKPRGEDDLIDDLRARAYERPRSGRCAGSARRAARSPRAALRGTRRRPWCRRASARSSAARSISGAAPAKSFSAWVATSAAVRRTERQNLEARFA